jgi:hypothetical protein
MSKLQTILEKEDIAKVEDTKGKIKEKIRIREEEISARYEEEKTEGTRSIMHPSIGMFETQKTPEVNLFKDTFKKKVLPPQPTKMFPGQFITSIKPQPRMQPQDNRYDDPFKRLEFWIPDSKLPPHIQYLKPVPINKDIDLAKLNPLINDSIVRAIECYGPGENIVVKGGMGVKKTAIILEKEEIDNIIQRFSKETKIPVQEGVFKVAAGRLILTAIISEIVGSKFLIKKITQEEINQGM